MALDLTISLTGANADTITFDYSNYILTNGLKGFGIPATSLRIQDSATDGGIFRHTKRVTREVDLPIMTVGTDRNDVETKLRRLANILQNSAGPAQLTATYADGTILYLNVYYSGGAETVFGDLAGSTYAYWLVTLQAPQPFWQSYIPTQFTVGAGSTGRGLLPALSKMRVSSSSQLGTVNVTNSGDVPCYPVWTVYGPVDSLNISPIGGTGFSFSGTISAGTIVTIDTYSGTVTDASGNNLYASLNSAPKFFALQPGTTSISVAGSNPTTATKITCTYYPRREVLH